MDVSVTITDDFAESLANGKRCFEDTAARFHASRDAGRDLDVTEIFQYSLRLKTKLDEVEANAVGGVLEPSFEILYIFLNCEYLIYNLNAETPIRYNPFLSHWVETVERLGQGRSHNKTSKTSSHSATITWQKIFELRVLLIQKLLEGIDLASLSSQSPAQLIESLPKERSHDFALEQYVKMLEEEDIYERSQSPEDHTSVAATSINHPAKRSGDTKPVPSPIDKSTEGVLRRLHATPDAADQILTRLPIDLAALDLLTKFVQDGTLEMLSLDRSSTIRDYLQHSLRQVERMGQRAVTTPNDGSDYITEQGVEGDGEVGREAQARAVRLLVLFMRNLICKALLSPDDILFEMREVWTRYLMIPDVQQFKAFVQGLG